MTSRPATFPLLPLRTLPAPIDPPSSPSALCSRCARHQILFKNFLTGLVLAITSFVLSLIDSTRATNLKLKYLFRLFPAFCLGESLLNLAMSVRPTSPLPPRHSLPH